MYKLTWLITVSIFIYNPNGHCCFKTNKFARKMQGKEM